MGFFDILTFQKYLCHFPIFFSSIGTKCIFLTELRRITGNTPDDLIGGIKELAGFIFLSVLSHKPGINTGITTIGLILQHTSGHFHIHSRNRQLIIHHFLKYPKPNFLIQHPQVFFDHAYISLQSLDKAAQILHQPILEYQKLFGMHHFFCFYTVQISHIILIVLIQPSKIIIQIIPPGIYTYLIQLCHLRKPLNTEANPLQKRRFQ